MRLKHLVKALADQRGEPLDDILLKKFDGNDLKITASIKPVARKSVGWRESEMMEIKRFTPPPDLVERRIMKDTSKGAELEREVRRALEREMARAKQASLDIFRENSRRLEEAQHKSDRLKRLTSVLLGVMCLMSMAMILTAFVGYSIGPLAVALSIVGLASLTSIILERVMGVRSYQFERITLEIARAHQDVEDAFGQIEYKKPLELEDFDALIASEQEIQA